MNKKLGQEPAFPSEVTYSENGVKCLQTGNYTYQDFGMSKRFYAACAAMQGLISNFSEIRKVNDGFIACTDHRSIVEQAYDIADELLKQENNG